MTKLISFEKFKENLKIEEDDMKANWNKELFACPVCSGGVKRDYSKVYMSNPPKYRYFCRNCSWSFIF